jgi:sigma-B regulation protein RsbU (phosphoserine phosphatase)
LATILKPIFDVTTASWCRPAGRAGGDFLLSFRTPSVVRLIVGDVSGHGDSVAEVAASVQARLCRDLLRPVRPALLRKWNRDLAEVTGERFVCLTYLELDLRDGTLTIANAGNPALLIRRSRGTVEAFANTGMVLGILEDEVWTPPCFIRTKLGFDDLVVCVTDGVIEQCSPGREQFGLERLVQALSDATRPPLRMIRRWVAAFSGHTPFSDDVTVLCVQPAARAARAA